MIFAAASDAEAIFPPFVKDVIGRMVQDQVFDRLAEINNQLTTVGDKEFTPRLAQKWTWARDSLSIAFSIDPRARWHDGKPVTAADVRYTYKTLSDPKVGSTVASTLGNLDSVTVRDSLTAVIWFKKHTPEQFYDAAYQLVIMPEHVYGKIPPEQLHTSDATRTIVGSGRFRLVRWDAGSRIELLSDTGNYRGRARLDRIIIVKTDPSTETAQLLSGQADFMEAFPNDQVAKLDSNAFARPLPIQQVGYGFMGMNRFVPKSTTTPHPIFSDIRVRRALSMAVDRVGMLRNIYGDKGRLSHGPFPMTLLVGDSTLRLPPYDTTAAKAMLDSSGWRVGSDGIRAKNGRPFRFTLISTTSSLPRRRYGILLQEQFRRIGVQVDFDNMDPQAYFPRMNAGDFDAIMAANVTDPSVSGSKQSWGTSGIGADGQNYMRYSNPKADAFLDSATSSFDPVKTKGYASRAFQTIIDDVPAVWLYDLVTVDAVNSRIDAAPVRADGWWANLADWSIPPNKRIDRDRIGLATPKS
ncbi:MAG TPA: peptide ABC transporter substrate-binding protein [Gemmatimonadaceae bacterium]|nr:peptide ABC transporter substrate-binding protein [Gemmatimonadaceae bacterium]